jgi:hypothetical protein
MLPRSAHDRRQLRTERRQSNGERGSAARKPVQLDRATHARLTELANMTGLRYAELIDELVTAELIRRRELAPAIHASERARLGRG